MTPPYKILVVEDESDSADVISRILKGNGMTCFVTPSAEDALETLIHDPEAFGIAVIDLALPRMDGFELVEQLCNTPSLAALKIIGVTGYHTPELAEKARQRGFDWYFPKPIVASALIKALKSAGA